MEFKLNPIAPVAESEMTVGLVAREEGSFSISPSPIVEPAEREEGERQPAELPRSYGTQSVWLLPRDPHSMFAYWDVDWQHALGGRLPTDRKAHLRIFDADRSQLTEREVEPMAGNCYVTVGDAGASYHVELGYYSPASTWNLVATSLPALTPPEIPGASGAVDFATVPFHLGFQHMIDLLRVYKRENESLTALLNELRQREGAGGLASTATPEQRNLARALDQAAQGGTAPSSSSPDLWAEQRLGHVIGLGRSSPAGGFGGSSRAA